MGWRQELGRSAVVGAAKAGKQLEGQQLGSPREFFPPVGDEESVHSFGPESEFLPPIDKRSPYPITLPDGRRLTPGWPSQNNVHRSDPSEKQLNSFIDLYNKSTVGAQEALAGSPEALAIEEQWKANEARDWDTGLAQALTKELAGGPGQTPAEKLYDWLPERTPFKRSMGGDFGWLNELAGNINIGMGGSTQENFLSKMVKMLNPTAHDAINSVIEENKMLEGSQLGGKVVEEDEWLDSEGNVVRPFRQPEHGNYAPVQSLP